MNVTWKGGLAAGVALLGGVFLGAQLSQPVRGNDEPKAAAVGPRYTVVQTRVAGLTVTDNRTNTLYFYGADEEGADLKMQGSIDLNAVGKDTLPVRTVKKN